MFHWCSWLLSVIIFIYFFLHPLSNFPLFCYHILLSSFLSTFAYLQFVQESPFLTRDLLESCFPYALLRDAYNSVYRKPQVCVHVHNRVCMCVCTCGVCVGRWVCLLWSWKPLVVGCAGFHICTCYQHSHCYLFSSSCSICHENTIVMVRLHFSGVKSTYSSL